MATLILSTVGTLVGGPIGSAIGATIGQAIDAELFKPPGREGPRLSDLRVQTSSYGSDVPAIVGLMRVAGTVIWASDMIEHRQRSGGKGQPTVTSFSYSVSIAVALSSRPLARIGRIWAEGNLLRGAAGDVKSPVTMRLHSGSEDQPVDPLMAAAVGMDRCPAYRGFAYVVLEDFDLAPFGNRIPSLTFEVEAAEAGPVTLASPLAMLLPDATVVDAGPALTGAALSGGTVRQWVEGFAPLLPVGRRGHRWQIGTDGEAAVAMLASAAKDAADRDSAAARGDFRQADDLATPAAVRIDAYEPSRDFQLVRVSARVAGGRGADELVTLPLAMDAATARQIAQRQARQRASRSGQYQWPQGFAALALSPGDGVRRPGDAMDLVIDERRIEGAGVRLSLRKAAPLASAGSIGGTGEAGSHAPAPDGIAGTTLAALFSVPIGDGGAAPRLLLAATGTGAGWRRGRVSITGSVGAEADVVGDITGVAVLGEVVAAGGSGGTALVTDRTGWIEVTLARPDMHLDQADDAALLGGANLALLGDEIIQFGRAEPLGAGRWRLSQLLRGRLGSDAAMAEAMLGRPFALARDPALWPLTSTMMPLAGAATVSIDGGMGPAVTLPLPSPVATLLPLSPVHARVRHDDDGGVFVDWLRRSRTGFGWVDSADAPLDQRDEHYVLTLGEGTAASELVVAVAQCRFDAAALLPWRAAGAVVLSIRQRGDAGLSPPLELTVPLV